MKINRVIFWMSLTLPGLMTGCQKAVSFKAAQATRTHVESTVTTTSSGTVEAEQEAVLGFSAVGRVAKIMIRNGDHVKVGKLLAELDNQDLKSLFSNAEAEYHRSKKLFESHLVSQAALDEAKKNRDVARANLDKTMLVAPFDGVITELNLELGGLSQVTAKTPIRIVDLKSRVVKGDIDEVDLAKVHVGNSARVRIQAVRAKPFEATVRKVIPYVSTSKEADRTSRIELQIQDENTLIPVGASADVEIVVNSKDQALAVPARTVLGSGESRYLYRLEDGRAKRTPIRIGIGNYDRIEVLSGVEEAQKVLYPSDEVELSDGLKVKAEVLTWP